MAPPVDSEESQQVDNSSDSYKLCFKVGNISVCNGCRAKFSDRDVIVIQHAEYRDYTNPRTGLPASRYGNAYYHLRKSCIQLKRERTSDISKISVPGEFKSRLTIAQKQQIHQEFGLTL